MVRSPPVLTVPSGAVVKVFTKEASDGQITESTAAGDLTDIDFGLIHPLTGPICVEGAGSLVRDLKISETVDVPHMLVSMHMPKGVFGG